MKPSIPPALDYTGDKAKSATLKGAALAFWDFIANQPGNEGLSVTRTKEFRDGTIITATVNTNDIHRYGFVSVYTPPNPKPPEPLSGFLFHPRYTAEDEENELGIEGQIKISPTTGVNQVDFIPTTKKGFEKIKTDVKYLAGSEYWTNGRTLLSWNATERSTLVKAYSHSSWVSQNLNSGFIFSNGKKIAHVTGLFYAASMKDYVLGIADGGNGFYLVAFTKEYVNWTSPVIGRYLKWILATFYKSGRIKKIHINKDCTKLVIIARPSSTDTPYVRDGFIVVSDWYDNYERIIEYSIELTTDTANPVVLTELSNTTQYFAPCAQRASADYPRWLNTSLIIDAWYDNETGDLQTETITAISLNNRWIAGVRDTFILNYTLNHPYLTAPLYQSVSMDQYNYVTSTIGSITASGSFLMRNNYYVNNPVVTSCQLSGALGLDSTDTLVTLSATRYDELNKISFPAISNKSSNINYYIAADLEMPFSTRAGAIENQFPHPSYDNWANFESTNSWTEYYQGVHEIKSLNQNWVWSDRYKNKLFVIMNGNTTSSDNGKADVYAFKTGKDTFGNPDYYIAETTLLNDSYQSAITFVKDIIGVI